MNLHLALQGPSAESRRQVQSRKVATAKYGVLQLDPVPDVQQVSSL
jgi:nuclear pore complex protein Nup205